MKKFTIVNSKQKNVVKWRLSRHPPINALNVQNFITTKKMHGNVAPMGTLRRSFCGNVSSAERGMMIKTMPIIVATEAENVCRML